MIELEKLSTEENNPNSKDIELQDSLEVVRRINEEDKKVAFCVEKELESISRLIDAILSKYKKETRIIYIGAGTSGRLGILDASECPPTYGVSFEKVQGIIAGGNEAIFKAKENAEDSPELGKQDLININLTKNDVVIGLAASGRTPYVLGAIEYANSIGAVTGSITCSKNSNLSKVSQYSIEVPVGILGIGEPLMYAVTLPLGKPFITACLGSGFGGVLAVLFHLGTISQGVSGLFGLLIVVPGSWIYFIVAMLGAYAGGFILTYLFGIDDEKIEEMYG